MHGLRGIGLGRPCRGGARGVRPCNGLGGWSVAEQVYPGRAGKRPSAELCSRLVHNELVVSRTLRRPAFKELVDTSLLMRVARGTPGLNRCLMWLARRYPENSIVTIRSGLARGLLWRRHHRYVSAYWLGYYELEIQRALKQHLRHGDRFFDVGGNAGFFTLVAARLVGPGGAVVAFEPLPESAASIREQVALNNLPWCRTIQEAISDQPGSASFAYDQPGSSIAHLGQAATTEQAIEVKVTTLDEACRRYGEPQMLKLDIEGAETRALAGARQLLSEVKPTWLVELHGPGCERAVPRMLQEAGYRLSDLSGTALDGKARLPRHILAKIH